MEIYLLLGGFLVFLVLIILVLAASIKRVPSGMVGIVHRTMGRSRENERWSVKVYGSPGPQAETLIANRPYLRLPFLYQVEYVRDVLCHRARLA